ncbi:uncharacterized protein [Ptychodera flava]|uniref:uncharacterized protein n=1 Tax=Ptychodera flava TaxID=63121 RepID=UPI00396A7B2C
MIDASLLQECFELDQWSFLKFIYISVLAGCDYLPSIPGVGIKRSVEFVKRIKDKDIFQAIPRMGLYLNLQITIPEHYVHNFHKAVNIFRHHMVFDVDTQCIVPLNTYDEGSCYTDMPYIGRILSKETALGLAVGNVSVNDLSIINNYSPSSIFTQSVNIEITVTGLEEAIAWTLPCCPVITLNLHVLKIVTPQSSQFADMSYGVIKLSDERLGVFNMQSLIKCSMSDCCIVNINDRPFLMLWKWTMINDTISVADSLESMSISSISSDTTSIARLNDINEDDPCNIEHSVPFKVLGVCHNMNRQEVLEAGYIRLYDHKLPVKACLRPDPSNKFDKDAIAVDLDVGNGWQHIGFIPSELTRYVHKPFTEGKLSVVVDHIRFRTTWMLVGFYVKITITKVHSMWENYVVMKSKKVR